MRVNGALGLPIKSRVGKQPVAAKQARAQDTRQRLIVAAIDCLTRYGFGGTTMSRISKVAGVSAGPRQYYFPTTARLFSVVLDYLLEQQNKVYSDPPLPTQTDHRIRAIIARSITYAGTPDHIAILEIKLALKHDQALRKLVGAKLEAVEAQADQAWVDAVTPLGVEADTVRNTRRILASISRGLALDTAPAATQRAAIADLVETMAFAALERRFPLE
jgi:AcrR family transcriptional regulator